MDLKKQIKNDNSLTVQLAQIDEEKAACLKAEENTKVERLAYLNDEIGLPYDKPIVFEATELIEKSPKFQKFYKENKKSKVAIRLIPKTLEVLILRMRGESLEKVVNEWFPDQKIDPKKYLVSFTRHATSETYGTIFIVNKNGIFGELVKGRHQQLAIDVFDKNNEPILFIYDFKNLTLSKENEKVRKHLKEVFSKINIKAKKLQEKINDKLGANFYGDYINGYFETVYTKDYGLLFHDYNRILGEWYKDFSITPLSQSNNTFLLTGKVASTGRVSGEVCIMHSDNLSKNNTFKNGCVLVCDRTTPDMIQYMKNSIAVITDIGGILSHTAIVARELGIPSIVGTQNATTVLENGDKVLLDITKGTVEKV